METHFFVTSSDTQNDASVISSSCFLFTDLLDVGVAHNEVCEGIDRLSHKAIRRIRSNKQHVAFDRSTDDGRRVAEMRQRSALIHELIEQDRD